MKQSAIIRIIGYTLVIVILATIMGCFIADDIYLSSESNCSESVVPTEGLRLVNDQTFTTQIQNIEIEWAAGSIVIHHSSSVSSIRVSETIDANSDENMVCHQAGQTLKIQYNKDSVEFPSLGFSTDISKDLVIVVPETWNCNTLEIDAAAADVQIIDLTINELDFDGASGNLILDNCNIADLDIDTASGDVEFSGVLKNLDFDAASAKFCGEFFQMPNLLNIDTVSGNMDIVLPEYCWFTCELDTASGSFHTDFATTTENGVYIHGSKENACHIKVSAMSGDVSILKGISSPETTK